MLFELLISVILGIFFGTFTGLAPGIHINLIGTILIGLSATALAGVNPLFPAVFIASMAITHIFVDFIPSIFLGCPDSDTQLSVLPGHEMLREGRGYEAVMLAAYGALLGSITLILIAFPSALLISKIYGYLHYVMAWILIGTSAVLIFTEKNKIASLGMFLLSGILGICALNMNLKDPLLPLLSGLFGSSMLIMSIKTKISLPEQEITKFKVKKLRPLLGAIIASPLCGFLPGLGGGQAAILGNSISKTDRKGFLVLVGATNVLVMGLSFVSVYILSKDRTGAAAAVHKIVGNLSWKVLLMLLLAILITGWASFFLTKFLAKILSQKINKINYVRLSLGTLAVLSLVVFIFSGFLGFIVLIISTITGIYCNSFNVRKTNMMGCLIIPTIILYFL